ncbi:MAG: VOC family protein [Gammaproteobacteria bacterium]|nr:VOC family protein [Gammaproteobacteria bacterium]
MAVLAMHHSSVIVSSTHDSLAFYQGVLGLELDNSRPDLGYPGAWLNVGQQQIHLLEVPNPDLKAKRPEHGGRDRHTALLVDDLDALIQSLEVAGIAYTLSKSGRKALFCRDPDANAVECIEQKSLSSN